MIDQEKLIDSFQKEIDFTFKDQTIVLTVLLHPSLTGHPTATKRMLGKKIEKYETYERLEFLGDRVLSLSISEWLYETYPKESEGDIAKRHTMLVKNETLAKISECLKLGNYVQISVPDGIAPAGFKNQSMNADVCEALLGAMFLDQGFEVARDFVRKIWRPFFDEYDQPQSDMKTKLQEWTQEYKHALPHYKVIKKEGEDHSPCFTIEVSIKNKGMATAVAPSKKEAEKKAAAILVTKLGIK